MRSRTGLRAQLAPKMPARWSSAMPDRKAYSLRDIPEPGGAPRLLNAAAWLGTLAALETEFKTVLRRSGAREEPGATPRAANPPRFVSRRRRAHRLARR